MKLLTVAGIFCALALTATAARSQTVPTAGAWTIDASRNSDSTVNFEIRIDRPGDHSNWGNDEDWNRLQGLSRSAVFSAGSTVHFDLVRDAGTLRCSGYVANGSGGGTFQYSPNPRFADELASRGVSRPSADEQARMTYSGVSLALVDTLRRYGYAGLTPEDLIRLTNHGVTQQYVSAIEAAGYHPGSAEELIRMVDHGVTTQYISAMRGLGYRPSAEELTRLVDHGVTADFTRTMISFGYHPSTDELVRLADHGVTPEFVRHLRSRGYNASIEELIRLRDAGV
ncbi:MAG TPA: helix-turn-helix transcriptional regulator [Candidatus Baltobacteraceae bacterium]|jgi:hypothetical protein|nr:helix-turn-helix transcriptional regulator [Candidatus Baltobacteraceae bacterium]